MKKLIFLVLAFLALTTAAVAQGLSTVIGRSTVNYLVSNGEITITESAHSVSGEVVIPATIDGLPVTSIGRRAFQNSPLTSVVIPQGVKSIGNSAFNGCSSLASVVIPQGVTNIGMSVFWKCSSLTDVTIPDTVVKIDDGAFAYCEGLTSIVVPDSVVRVGNRSFMGCISLATVTFGKNFADSGAGLFNLCFNLTDLYFKGNAPFMDTLGPDITIHYLAGTTGWGPTYGGAPTAIWELPLAQNSIRVSGPGQLEFNWYGQVVVEASTDMVHWSWLATLPADSTSFTDPNRANYPVRFYRLRSF